MSTTESSPDRYDPSEFAEAKRQYEAMHRPAPSVISHSSRDRCSEVIENTEETEEKEG